MSKLKWLIAVGVICLGLGVAVQATSDNTTSQTNKQEQTQDTTQDSTQDETQDETSTGTRGDKSENDGEALATADLKAAVIEQATTLGLDIESMIIVDGDDVILRAKNADGTYSEYRVNEATGEIKTNSKKQDSEKETTEETTSITEADATAQAKALLEEEEGVTGTISKVIKTTKGYTFEIVSNDTLIGMVRVSNQKAKFMDFSDDTVEVVTFA